MTVSVTVDPGSHAALVLIQDQGTGDKAQRLEPGSGPQTFRAYPGRTLTVSEIQDDGAGERPVDPDAPEA